MNIRRFGVHWLAGALLAVFAAAPAFAADDPQISPSALNPCWPKRPVHMAPIPSTQISMPYPEDARRRGQKGHVFLRVLVDKYGFARHPEVVISSGYAQLDQAAIDSITDRWRWEPPPPECAESGVITSMAFNWSLKWTYGEPQPDPIYLDDTVYPADARARKQGGEGKVEYTVSTDYNVTDAHVIDSTGSPELDAAMVTHIRNRVFIVDGTTSTTATKTQRFEFVPENNPDTLKALMGPVIVPDPRFLPGREKPVAYVYVEPYPAPGLANACGRSARVYLEHELTNVNPPYPVEASGTGKQGRTVLDVLVDKSGTAADVTVAQSSGSPALDLAAVDGIKGLWHYQTPPPECADQGVLLRTNFDWFQGNMHWRVMAGDPGYPAEATAGKLSGSGMVQIIRSSRSEDDTTKVLTSTGSDILDAAMAKLVRNMRPMRGTRSTGMYEPINYVIDFVGDPDAMRAAAAAPVRRAAPLAPPPSAANDCGRGGDVYLAPVDSSHTLVPIPSLKMGDSSLFLGVKLPVPFMVKAQGALKMQVLVDKDGKAASVTVAASSAPPEMERAVTGTVKENYRWAPPPPECADKGVMLNVNYIYTTAPEKLQIYADDADYPEAARVNSMGAAGMVEVRFHGDKIDDAKMIVSTKVPELDAAMIKVVSDRLLADLRAIPQNGSATQTFPVMFMPAFVSSPAQLAAQRTQSQAASSSAH